jgi:hypothetical protein
VPDRMNADLPYAMTVADADKRAHEVARLDRPAGPGAENQAGVGPGRPEFCPVGILLLLASGQYLAPIRRTRQLRLGLPLSGALDALTT